MHHYSVHLISCFEIILFKKKKLILHLKKNNHIKKIRKNKRKEKLINTLRALV